MQPPMMRHGESLLPGTVARTGVTGAECTTFRIGGPFSYLYEPTDEAALAALLPWLADQSSSWRVLGAGSNLVVADEGVIDPVIRLGVGFRDMDWRGGTTLRIGAAASLMSLSRRTAEQGLAGLEFAAGIPGSVGGAVRMNAGAHGSAIGDLLTAVAFVFPNGETCELSRDELHFSYRHSEFPPGAIVSSVTLNLVRAEAAAVKKRRAQLLAERKERQPLTDPCAGSVFKNPAGERAAAELIEAAGLKGVAEGGVCVSPKHANWIVNPRRQGTASDVRELVERVQAEVSRQFAILLEPELVFWNNHTRDHN